MNEEKNQRRIEAKCPHCFKRDGCMLLPVQRATLCLGPFKSLEDQLQKIRTDQEKEVKPKADLRRFEATKKIDQYWLNRHLFEFRQTKREGNDDETLE